MKYLLSFILLFSIACSSEKEKELPNYSKTEMFEWAKAGHESFQLVLPTSVGKIAVDCRSYKPACKTGIKAKVKDLEFKVLYYETQKDALQSAKRIKGYIARNWVFDDVKGEPILERFVKKHLKADLAIK